MFSPQNFPEFIFGKNKIQIEINFLVKILNSTMKKVVYFSI